MNISKLEKAGYLIIDHFATAQQCEEILDLVASYREKYELTEIYRPDKERSLKYFVINGEEIERNFPEVQKLYKRVNQLVNQVGNYNLVPLSNKIPAVNINIVTPGGEYRWHYDRNAVTALLYLNAVQGGEIELYPNYRIGLSNQKFTFLQKDLDAILKSRFIRDLLGKKITISPRPGMMILMKGDRCLHSVKAVEGNQERINIVMAYDSPEAQFPVEKELDSYLYTNAKQVSSDPNYVETFSRLFDYLLNNKKP